MNWKTDIIDIVDDLDGCVGPVENRGDHMILRFKTTNDARNGQEELLRMAYRVVPVSRDPRLDLSKILQVYPGRNLRRKNENTVKVTVGEIRSLVAEAVGDTEPMDFVGSIKKQFARVRDIEDLRHVADTYDAIIGALMMPKHRQTKWFTTQDPFTKWHYRKAKQQLNAGMLSLDDLPSGDELYAEEEHRRDELRTSQDAARGRSDDRTPEERAHAQHMAVYGGEENYRKGVGLGT
jgi:hypothetical protein